MKELYENRHKDDQPCISGECGRPGCAWARTEREKDLELLRSLPRYKMVNELEESSRPFLQSLALILNLPLRYSSGELKSKDVLTAAVYQHITEQPQAKG